MRIRKKMLVIAALVALLAVALAVPAYAATTATGDTPGWRGTLCRGLGLGSAGQGPGQTGTSPCLGSGGDATAAPCNPAVGASGTTPGGPCGNCGGGARGGNSA